MAGRSGDFIWIFSREPIRSYNMTVSVIQTLVHSGRVLAQRVRL